MEAILSALAGSGLEKIVALSTYGACAEKQCADLSILYQLEQSLASQSIPATILRTAYLMSNWESQIDSARTDGVLHSMLPADLVIPMVAPEDVGRAAARLLTETEPAPAKHYIEGPQRYSPAEVAAALAGALARPVRTQVVPPDKLEETFRSFGLSAPAAKSYANMTKATIKSREMPEAPMRGSTSLDDFFKGAVTGGHR